MMNTTNPFILFGYAGKEYFCDRETETNDMLSTLKNGRNITLRSARRVGKTGLIYHAFDRLAKSDIRCFYIDILSTRSLSDLVVELGKAVIGKLDSPLQKVEGVVARFFKTCRLYFSTDPLTGSPQLGLDFVDDNVEATLEEIFAYLRKSEVDCYIAIDEFQQILEYPEKNVEAILRKYIQQCQNVHFIFSGSKQHLMSEMFNSPRRPFYRSTDKLTLDVIPEPTYYEFAATHLQKAGTKLSNEIFHTIYSLVDGYTWYIQYILNRLYELNPQEATLDIVLACVDYILKLEQDDYKQMYNMLTNNQAQVLRAIAREKVVTSITSKDFLLKYKLPAASSVKRAVEFLIDNEYIYHSDKGYIVYDRFMAIWLERL